MLKSTLLSALLRIVVHQKCAAICKVPLKLAHFFFNDNIVFLFEHIGHALGASAIKHLGLTGARRLGLASLFVLLACLLLGPLFGDKSGAVALCTLRVMSKRPRGAARGGHVAWGY